MNKKLKTVFSTVGITVAAGIIITPITLLTSCSSSGTSLSAAGSSSVFPLMTAYSEEYTKADLTTNAGGSGVGIKAALDGTSHFGMASKDPFSDFEKNKDKWTERNLKTVTLAWDGMGLVYKDTSDAPVINLTPTNIENVYKAFAGHDVVSYEDLGWVNPNPATPPVNTAITPYARTGGATASGTADAFLGNNNLLSDADQERVEGLYEDELDAGNYGPITKQTQEANSQAWQQISTASEPGAMVYLSAGYILNNMTEITEKGFKVATYNGQTLSKTNVSTGYDWFRPLNIIFSLDENQAVIDFAKWAIGDTTLESGAVAKTILEEEGFVSLSDAQKATMKKDGTFEVSDVDLGYTGAKFESTPAKN